MNQIGRMLCMTIVSAVPHHISYCSETAKHKQLTLHTW